LQISGAQRPRHSARLLKLRRRSSVPERSMDDASAAQAWLVPHATTAAASAAMSFQGDRVVFMFILPHGDNDSCMAVMSDQAGKDRYGSDSGHGWLPQPAGFHTAAYHFHHAGPEAGGAWSDGMRGAGAGADAMHKRVLKRTTLVSLRLRRGAVAYRSAIAVRM